MIKKDFLTEFMEAMENDVKGIIAVAIVEMESGMTLVSKSFAKNFDPEVASAYNVEVVKAKLAAMKALKLEKTDSIDDILITLTSQIHLLKITPSAKHLIYLAVDSKEANLGMVRSILRLNTADIDENL
ncbi:MAG: hypothetical protein JXR03_05425 [Cyclobacteriaceae bacterium]